MIDKTVMVEMTEQEYLAQKRQEDFAEFAFHFGQSIGFVDRALKDPEVLAEFASRGVFRHELIELSITMKKLAAAFYKRP